MQDWRYGPNRRYTRQNEIGFLVHAHRPAAADIDLDGVLDFAITSKDRSLYVFDQNGLKFSYPTSDFLISTPYWRSDISIEEDLIEEIARVLGYESIPALPLTGPIPTPIPQPVGELRENIRDLMVEAGLQEIITHTLVNDPAAFDQGSICLLYTSDAADE